MGSISAETGICDIVVPLFSYSAFPAEKPAFASYAWCLASATYQIIYYITTAICIL
jgi:hypothetical protein